MTRPPIAAGYLPIFNVSAGYSITDLALPSSSRVALSGLNVGLTVEGGRRLGAEVDLSYARASNIFNSGHRADMLSYLFGPRFSLWNNNSLSAYAHVLGGGARVAEPFLNATGGLSVGHVQYPAVEFGGSVEYRLSPAFGLRVGADLLHAHFYNSAGAVRGQNDIRIVNSIVYYLGEPVWRTRHRTR